MNKQIVGRPSSTALPAGQLCQPCGQAHPSSHGKRFIHSFARLTSRRCLLREHRRYRATALLCGIAGRSSGSTWQNLGWVSAGRRSSSTPNSRPRAMSGTSVRHRCETSSTHRWTRGFGWASRVASPIVSTSWVTRTISLESATSGPTTRMNVSSRGVVGLRKSSGAGSSSSSSSGKVLMVQARPNNPLHLTAGVGCGVDATRVCARRR